MTRASRTSGRAQQACLNVACVVGVLAIVWFLLSLFLGWSLVLFKTGSMAPTYPTGAAAVAVPVAADAIEPGDVVTVPRAAGGLPVTHRVIAVADPATGDGARELTLQGDDNATPDKEVYRVTEADRVVVGVPYVGYGVTLLAQPKTLAILTAVVAALTVWVFWPRPELDDEPDDQADDGPADEVDDTTGDATADATADLATSRSSDDPGVPERELVGTGDAPALTRAMLREGRRQPPPTHGRTT